MKIAFTLIASKAWMGGFNYLLNLLTGIAQFESERLQPFIFCGDDASDSDVLAFQAISGVTVVRSSVFNAGNRQRGLYQALFTGVDSPACNCFKGHDIEIVFEPATFYGWRSPFPTLAWFPDLQHKLMPEFFTRAGWWRREIGFRLQIASGRKILLSSETARQDCKRFYPGTSLRTEVLQFPARITATDLQEDPYGLLASYDLPGAFAFLPNQFWKHKNHAVVIEALGILRKKGLEVTVVATGNPKDPRHPGLYEELEQRMKTLGVSDNFRMLGMVPRSHLLALLQTCSVLINPSRFEGWSTTVEEGKALGIPMILSDLPVHREQTFGQAKYFDTDDANKLAGYLEIYAGAKSDNPRNLQMNSDSLLAYFASRFADIAIQHNNLIK